MSRSCVCKRESECTVASSCRFGLRDISFASAFATFTSAPLLCDCGNATVVHQSEQRQARCAFVATVLALVGMELRLPEPSLWTSLKKMQW